MITVPRGLLIGVGAAFSAYHVVLGASTLAASRNPWAVLAALALYAVATAVSLALGRGAAIPTWLAGLNVGVVIAIALLVDSTVRPATAVGYDTWYVAAAGTLLTITAVRRHILFAWAGIAVLVVETVLWAGPLAPGQFGVIGDVVWVAVANVFIRALARATVDVRQFARAEREAAEWQAAQDAHHFERQVRLTQTSRVALPMLEHVASTGGELDAADRQECRVLEQTIRDEIRGRRLLNDAVREQVIAARRRGAFVQVLDDGGVDDVDPADLDPVLDRLAAAIASVRSDRIVVRTAPRGSKNALTVVGVTSDPTASALGLDDEEEVDLWLELPRPGVQAGV